MDFYKELIDIAPSIEDNKDKIAAWCGEKTEDADLKACNKLAEKDVLIVSYAGYEKKMDVYMGQVMSCEGRFFKSITDDDEYKMLYDGDDAFAVVIPIDDKIETADLKKLNGKQTPDAAQDIFKQIIKK